MAIALIGIIIGLIIGFMLPYTYNTAYSLYISMAILACLDALFGGVKANIRQDFDTKVFLSGFFGNSLLAAFLTYLGDRLGVPMYYAVIVTFGGRVFDNFAAIRRLLLEKHTKVDK